MLAIPINRTGNYPSFRSFLSSFKLEFSQSIVNFYGGLSTKTTTAMSAIVTRHNRSDSRDNMELPVNNRFTYVVELHEKNFKLGQRKMLDDAAQSRHSGISRGRPHVRQTENNQRLKFTDSVICDDFSPEKHISVPICR